MEARIFRAALLAAVLFVSTGASYRTPNFIIQTRDPQLAERFGKAAEKYRRELAVVWLGREMPDWSHPCPITIQVGSHLGAGGATTFMFDRGEVFGWRMSIQGSVERLLDSVLPHEITHMIFASHFRQPLPRWADEGGASTVEHPSERMKHRRMLIHFLKSDQGIAFDRMFAMTEYPPNMMPLYAQGHSVADFLIQQGGPRKYVDFVGDGLKAKHWSAALEKHYGVRDLSTLQKTWLAWVKRGSPPLQPPATAVAGSPQADAVAASGKLPRPEPNLIYRSEEHGRSLRSSVASEGEGGPIVAVSPPNRDSPAVASVASGGPAIQQAASGEGWRARDEPLSAPASDGVEADAGAAPVRAQTAHPQPFQQPKQIVLEWGRQ